MIETDVKIKLFDIQRFSLHDGPGIRTTVFFNGCPLRCPWCSNPESQRGRVELMHFPKKCVHCGRCAQACPNGAIEFSGQTGPLFHRDRCVGCGSCARACLSDALELSGKCMTAGEVMEIVKKDESYYRKTGGGITVSGGEPLLQPEGAAALLGLAKSEKLHTALETTGAVSQDAFSRVDGLVDLYLFDLKHSDPQVLCQVTGGDLEQILGNLEWAAGHGEVLVRVPVIPGFNHGPMVMNALFSLAREKGVKTVDLLPYHVLGKNKYAELGLPYAMQVQEGLEKKELLPYVALGEKQQLQVLISGKAAVDCLT